jgi:hypothetical protein
MIMIEEPCGRLRGMLSLLRFKFRAPFKSETLPPVHRMILSVRPNIF